MIITRPTKFFLASGSGEGNTALTAFDAALLDSGVANTNLLRLTSILPPKCKEVKPFKLPLGAIVPVVYSMKTSSTPGELISACVAIGVPAKDTNAGLIMEYSHSGENAVAEKIIKGMVKEGFNKRKWKLKKIIIASAQHKVIKTGAVCAVVVLWD